MHRIRIMALQPAAWAGKAHLARAKQRLRKAQKQRHTTNHDEDGKHFAEFAFQRDVTKPGRGQRRHGEIKRIGVIGDFRIDAALRFIHQRGHDKNENRQMHASNQRFFMPAEEGHILPQFHQRAIGMQ